MKLEYQPYASLFLGRSLFLVALTEGVGFGRRPYNFRSSSSSFCLFLVSATKWTQTLAIAANVSRAVASGNVENAVRTRERSAAANLPARKVPERVAQCVRGGRKATARAWASFRNRRSFMMK